MAKYASGKFFHPNPQILQRIGDRILNEFAPDCRVSKPLPSTRGDYHILVTIYKVEATK